MEEQYCKLKDGNKVYLIESVSKDIVRLRNGNSVVTTDVSNIQYLSKENISTPPTRGYAVEVSEKEVPLEIMLRHKLKEEAIWELDKYIDQAIVAHIPRVRIIHGKHGGTLRKAVHEYLSTNPFVKEYFIADYNEGGYGVTIAILKNRI